MRVRLNALMTGCFALLLASPVAAQLPTPQMWSLPIRVCDEATGSRCSVFVDDDRYTADITCFNGGEELITFAELRALIEERWDDVESFDVLDCESGEGFQHTFTQNPLVVLCMMTNETWSCAKARAYPG